VPGGGETTAIAQRVTAQQENDYGTGQREKRRVCARGAWYGANGCGARVGALICRCRPSASDRVQAAIADVAVDRQPACRRRHVPDAVRTPLCLIKPPTRAFHAGWMYRAEQKRNAQHRRVARYERADARRLPMSAMPPPQRAVTHATVHACRAAFTIVLPPCHHVGIPVECHNTLCLPGHTNSCYPSLPFPSARRRNAQALRSAATRRNPPFPRQIPPR